MSFAANLIRIMQSAGITNAALARRLKISSQAITQWRTGHTHPIGRRLEELADALGVPASALVDQTTGLAESAAPLAPPAMKLPDLADDPPDDDHDALATAAQAMLEQEGSTMPPKAFSRLMLHLWQEFQDEGAAKPPADRIKTVVERRRLMIRTAARHATGPYRKPG